MEDLYRGSSPDFDFSTYRNGDNMNKVRSVQGDVRYDNLYARTKTGD